MIKVCMLGAAVFLLLPYIIVLIEIWERVKQDERI